jgi:hypothetical protein
MSDYEDTDRELTYADLLQACEHRDPQFASMAVRYLDQDDPPENVPEELPEPSSEASKEAGDEAGDEAGAEAGEPPPLPGDAWTLERLRAAVSSYQMWGKTADEKHALRREAWDALMAAPYPPPRLRLGDLLADLYERGDAWSRAALLEIFARARIGWGIWKGFKRIYKLVEERHDPEMFGVLAWRLDAMNQTETNHAEVSVATFGYMRRRAWRYLRQLGQAVPEIYPQFAVQVLRHYPANHWFYDSWIASQIWAHKDLIGARSAHISGPPKKLDRRAFDDAWKISPDPLLRLLEDARCDEVCDFAIRGLKADFPESLRQVDPGWLARIGQKRLASVHTFVVEILEGSPEFHQSKLKALGLHDMVLGLLGSDSDKACSYAIEYASSHAPDIPVADLIEIAESENRKAQDFVKARLAKKTPAELGMHALVRMLAVSALVKLAREKFEEGFKPDDLSAELYVALANGDSDQQDFVKAFFKKHKQRVPAAFLRAQLEDPEMSRWEIRRVLQELGKHKAKDIGVEWIKDALLDRRFGDQVAEWLRKGMLKGEDLDVEWVKGLVMRPSQRALAIEILGNTRFVAPSRLGLSWLLAMARQADDTLSGFAHRYLLEHFAPDDFALEMNSADIQVGIDKIWSLLSPSQAEPIRRFASTYLRVHHPDLNATMDEARQYGIKPMLPPTSYTLARVRPLFSDAGADMRGLARAIGRHELVRWGDRKLVYQLAASRYREGRRLAAEALLHIGDSEADPKLVPPADWLVPAQVFALAESPIKATREIALTLIRRHYEQLGGAHKLAWLMESPDREVRLFAVRLLWEKHRPVVRPVQSIAQPAEPRDRPVGSRIDQPPERFDSVKALQQFLRTVLFGLPPGRMERRESTGEALPDRPLPASVAKRRLIDVVRDMAEEEREFAQIVIPVLEEFMHSQAKGEWQSCVAALARIRSAHSGLETGLPEPVAPPLVIPSAPSAPSAPSDDLSQPRG